MNGTPRTLNRVLVFLFGAAVLAVGAIIVLLATIPAVGAWWHTWAPSAAEAVGVVFEGSRVPGTRVSWLWLMLTVAAVVVVLLMIWWIAQQGKGRRDLVASTGPDGGAGPGGEFLPGEVPGRVSISAAAVEQAMRAALAPRKDVLGSSVAAVDFEGRTALRLRLVARQGADPAALAADAGWLVTRLESVVGISVPVLVHITSGARSRFSRAERVR
ncbi:hypothetical protein GCM10012320_07460 [Sinomonas cellulolyticus]|uniref:Alkaline shock response membrane anchor protein AmaP n=1 Tax=Sinomonas cellulolyticus TaxID=2801916 RepID=A0ABS1K328_9MICC|nr:MULTISPECIES: hypothetical protein [Sinomonas]MBL0706071.1 hypothetical protein [Sinomonas cellulolyticus]GHG43342.1 hypothetical protein GCM10012320_07460 [Sinomonas sp. KCTC 49339]